MFLLVSCVIAPSYPKFTLVETPFIVRCSATPPAVSCTIYWPPFIVLVILILLTVCVVCEVVYVPSVAEFIVKLVDLSVAVSFTFGIVTVPVNVGEAVGAYSECVCDADA